MKELFNILVGHWPEIVAAFSGFIVSFFLYLKSRLNYRTQVIEKDKENLKLQQVIAAGSYILCPECGKKIFLTEAKIFTGGLKDEIKNKDL